MDDVRLSLAMGLSESHLRLQMTPDVSHRKVSLIPALSPHCLPNTDSTLSQMIKGTTHATVLRLHSLEQFDSSFKDLQTHQKPYSTRISAAFRVLFESLNHYSTKARVLLQHIVSNSLRDF